MMLPMTSQANSDEFFTGDFPPPLVFSESAARKVKNLIEEEKNPNLKLRVFITGGGCSGFQYGFEFDENRYWCGPGEMHTSHGLPTLS